MPKVIKSYSGEDVIWILALTDTEMENFTHYIKQLKLPVVQAVISQHKRIRDAR